MAEIRLSPKDLARLDKLQGQVGAAVRDIDAVAVERVGREIAQRVNATVTTLLANVDKLAENLGVSDTQGLRQKLEAAQGASSAVQEVGPLIAALPLPPALRVSALVAVGVLGGIEGANRETTRRRIAQAQAADDVRLYVDLANADAARDLAARYRAAVTRARSFR